MFFFWLSVRKDLISTPLFEEQEEEREKGV